MAFKHSIYSILWLTIDISKELNTRKSFFNFTGSSNIDYQKGIMWQMKQERSNWHFTWSEYVSAPIYQVLTYIRVYKHVLTTVSHPVCCTTETKGMTKLPISLRAKVLQALYMQRFPPLYQSVILDELL